MQTSRLQLCIVNCALCIEQILYFIVKNFSDSIDLFKRKLYNYCMVFILLKGKSDNFYIVWR